MNLGKGCSIRSKNYANSHQQKGRSQFQIEAEKQSFAFTITLEAVDQLSCKLTELTVTQLQKKRANRSQFDAILHDLSKKLSYLQESIVLIERDDQNNQAMLRSANPHTEQEKIEYFEMMVNPRVEANL